MKSKFSNDKQKRSKRIVGYSSESSDDEPKPDKKLKIDTPQLSLPLSITKMFEERETKDDSSLHEGRRRLFPHVRGNWVSYVHVRPDSTEQLELAAKAVVKEFSLCGIELKPQNEFHISLSRTLPIPHHWINPILNSLSKLADSCPSFSVSFGALKLLSNEDRSRSFVVLEIDLGQLKLESLVSGIDSILAGYKLPQFYRPISLHASIAWGVGDLSKEKTVSALDKVWTRDVSQIFDGLCFDIDCLCFKTGHKLYNYPFKRK